MSKKKFCYFHFHRDSYHAFLLTEYTPENPKILTQCSHPYHLSCIYEWMERSETCPVCCQVNNFLFILLSKMFSFINQIRHSCVANLLRTRKPSRVCFHSNVFDCSPIFHWSAYVTLHWTLKYELVFQVLILDATN